MGPMPTPTGPKMTRPALSGWFRLDDNAFHSGESTTR
jgi:hypothetical protein